MDHSTLSDRKFKFMQMISLHIFNEIRPGTFHSFLNESLPSPTLPTSSCHPLTWRAFRHPAFGPQTPDLLSCSLLQVLPRRDILAGRYHCTPWRWQRYSLVHSTWPPITTWPSPQVPKKPTLLRVYLQQLRDNERTTKRWEAKTEDWRHKRWQGQKDGKYNGSKHINTKINRIRVLLSTPS